jgi:hypothetical protein
LKQAKNDRKALDLLKRISLVAGQNNYLLRTYEYSNELIPIDRKVILAEPIGYNVLFYSSFKNTEGLGVETLTIRL